MRRLKYIVLGFLTASLLGCEDKLRDLNTDPDILEKAQPENLFAGATENFMSPQRHYLTGRFAGVMTFMQYLVESGGSDGSAYIAPNKKDENVTPGLSFFWDYYYSTSGLKMRQLIKQIDENSLKDRYAGLQAVARILEVHQAWVCLDLYGAMPYTEGLQAILENGTRTPKYDFIWDLYKKFDDIVREQVSILNGLNVSDQISFADYDFFYNGKLEQWKKFGNSLRLKMALRYEHRDPEFLKTVYNDIAVQSGEQLMASNEDGCWYNHPSDFNNNIDDINGIRTKYETTEAFVNTLKGMGDPRLPILVRKNSFAPGVGDYDALMANAADSLDKYNPTRDRYLGMPASPYAVNEGKAAYGVRIKESVSATWKGEGGASVTKSVRLISLLQGRYFVKNGGYKSGETDPLNERWIDNNQIKMRTCILSYADLCFTMAEIAEKYGLTRMGSAEDWYRKGVEASINMYITLATETYVPDRDIEECRNRQADFLNSPVMQYTGSQEEKLEKIYTQAWINYLKHPEEAYAMWKRTGYPKFRDWQPGEEVKAGYLDKLYGTASMDESSVLLIPRRQAIPQRDENYANWDAAVKGQMAKDAAYGETANDCRGRIWWDAGR